MPRVTPNQGRLRADCGIRVPSHVRGALPLTRHATGQRGDARAVARPVSRIVITRSNRDALAAARKVDTRITMSMAAASGEEAVGCPTCRWLCWSTPPPCSPRRCSSRIPDACADGGMSAELAVLPDKSARAPRRPSLRNGRIRVLVRRSCQRKASRRRNHPGAARPVNRNGGARSSTRGAAVRPSMYRRRRPDVGGGSG
jgi:hypothetical protein